MFMMKANGGMTLRFLSLNKGATKDLDDLIFFTEISQLASATTKADLLEPSALLWYLLCEKLVSPQAMGRGLVYATVAQ